MCHQLQTSEYALCQRAFAAEPTPLNAMITHARRGGAL